MGYRTDPLSNISEIIYLVTQTRKLRQNEELKSDQQAYKVSTSSLLHHMNDSPYKIVVALAIREGN